MNEILSNYSIKSEQVIFWLSVVFLSMMWILFIVDQSVVLVEFKIYSPTTTGVFGVLSVIAFGCSVSKRGRPQKSFWEHTLFSLGFSFITVLFYYVAYTIAEIIFNRKFKHR